MVDKHTQDVDKQAYKYEVEVSMPERGGDIAALKIKLAQAKIFPADKLALFFSTLKSKGSVIVKNDATEAQAAGIARRFTSIGFRAIAAPVLTLQKADHYQRAYTCPACDAEVTLTEDRQCPACEVYVDNLSKEFLLKKKIMKEEQARAKGIQHSQAQKVLQEDEAALEERLRTEIRQEMEQKYKIRMRSYGANISPKRKIAYGAFATLGAALLFGSGWFFAPKTDNIQAATANTNKNGGELKIAIKPNMRIDKITVSDGEAVFDEEVLPQDASYAPDMQAQADVGDFSGGGGLLLSKRRSQMTYANLALT